MAALYVTPKDAKANISSQIISASNSILSVAITNSGNKHQILLNPVLTFEKGSQKWTLKEKDLQGFAGENVLAGQKRQRLADFIRNLLRWSSRPSGCLKCW